MSLTTQHIRMLPKGDLHNHFMFGYRRDLLGFEIPTPRRFNDVKAMINFAKAHIWPAFYDAPEHRKYFDFCAENTPKTAHDDGVTRLETSVDIAWCYRLFYPDATAALGLILDQARKVAPVLDMRIDLGLSPNLLKLSHPEAWFESLLDTGLVSGIDVYSCENKGIPFTHFKWYFQQAQRYGICRKGHLGEFMTDPTQIRSTIDDLSLQVLQHGFQAARSPDLIAYLIDKNIQLNLCPSSNIALGLVEDLKQHPIRILYDQGLAITVNTDDITIFESSLSDEYFKLLDNGLFSWSELDEIRMRSIADHAEIKK